MANVEKKLQVRNLRISFRTSNGKVQAVRGIDFDLNKGETLAIVGESGSGKSVTSKAILGILAGNAIVESGEIIYDGRDLLKITEEDFHHIRGDKIAMIFQDPMSSLNPIVRIGKQLTEAMILKGKARQRESRTLFNTYLKNLKNTMIAAGVDPSAAAANCKKFDTFEFKHIELESAYNKAHEAVVEAIDTAEPLIFELEKNQPSRDAAYRIKDIAKRAKESVNPYVVLDYDRERVFQLAGSISRSFKNANGDYSIIIAELRELTDIMKIAKDRPAPNFFRMGYYLKFSGQPLPNLPVDKLDEYMKDYLDRDFMLAFIADAESAVKYAAVMSQQKMRDAIASLSDKRAV